MSDSKITRREAVRRMATLASAIGLVGCVYPDVNRNPNSKPIGWPNPMKQAEGPGYGTDPNLIFPSVPWDLVLTPQELTMLDRISEILVPGSNRTDVTAVINEWVSAPYPAHQTDRALVQPGLQWMSQRIQSQAELIRLVKQLTQDADARVESIESQFLSRLRTLVAGAYYSSPQGVEELGYQGNRPIHGSYPGPNAAAQAHLDQLLQDLGLAIT